MSPVRSGNVSSPPLLAVENLRKYFSDGRGTLRAVDDVSFSIRAGETLGLVGESGCGKSTVGRTVMRLYEPTSGRILLDGLDIAQMGEQALRPLRRNIQMVFQDPYASLNPRSKVGRILEEPFIVHGGRGRGERWDRVASLLQRVGLNADAAERYPHEFSGGQRQRIGIARALALNPKIIVCDEAVSALDVSIRAQVINLLLDLQQDLGIAYLFISHDLAVVEHIADRIAVMYLGQIVETAPAESLWSHSWHPYTRALLSAAPHRAKADEPKRYLLEGELPSPMNPPPGCRFSTRCPFATDVCRESSPAEREIMNGHFVSCHHSERIFGFESSANRAAAGT
ncbi:dipeptide ABC transporter ATP-binding protein [Bradyrhizobium sp. Arg237L]|uniref:ABC transporter ATP-binding protein n=1 Tax=Bradyrhizobium sp. Arg237L TaxID=3003352 RepID=UPI00249DE7A1|nr:dipeptide ABC transporter ATP-binding protein [Bradyrhizobium sp. Arg237L]MDI4234129.1 dipeptide ABC transporter ATP-binding protein [Bradyrhizobium sp. Arg237L]